MLLAVNQLIEGKRPDLVLSGVNRGSNLGEDVTYSGTIAAAMEATLLGDTRGGAEPDARGPDTRLACGRKAWADVVRRLMSVPWSEGTLVNVNFPYLAKGDVTGIQVVRQGRRDLQYRGDAGDRCGRAANISGSAISPAIIPSASGTDLSAVREQGDRGNSAASRSDPSRHDAAADGGLRLSLAARKIRLIMALRRSGVTDTNVLAAIERIPREDLRAGVLSRSGL